ncbi:uncharacterized protein LOC100902733 [Galendromus occidentalis]|uniref:Uncharacterized protein LOC100902733 n=1 Tax=Galendromus occidentalis TaxID=34638 RepID=A0AAJ6VXP7_9ACAR|nr:uncharacterized protein LOC100902733 [Galendromus occidentalis]
MNRVLLTACVLACLTNAYRLRRSHISKSVITFPHDDHYACSTPYRQPGVCVPIEACPELRRVSLYRLSKFLCGFDAGDVPLLCCERQLLPPAPAGPLSTPPSGAIPTVKSSTGFNPNQSIAPVPLLCSVSVHEGRRLKSCWFLALQRVVYPEDGDEPILPEGPVAIEKNLSVPNTTPNPTEPIARPIGDLKPSKTSVTSD